MQSKVLPPKGFFCRLVPSLPQVLHQFALENPPSPGNVSQEEELP